jgi:hypothetical protein
MNRAEAKQHIKDNPQEYFKKAKKTGYALYVKTEEEETVLK